MTRVTDYTGNFRLDGKTALVTGAARGIGAAVASALAQSGARVVVTDIARDAGEQTASAIRAAGGEALFLVQNVTEEARWAEVIAETERHFGALDILVNNAGIETASLIATCTLSDFRHVMDINVNGVFLGLREAVRAMQPGGSSGRGGAIVNLSSVAGLIGTSGHIAYHTSKGAVRLMTKAAAVECAQLKMGIRVNSIHPAIIETDMGRAFVRGFVEMGLAPDEATAAAGFKAAHPIGHFGEPSDVASAVVYLASPAAKYITGTELVVDGGYTAA